MYRQFALTIAATALISAINALTLKPAQCAVWLRPVAKKGWFSRAFDAVYKPIERGYGWSIKYLLKVWWLVLVIFVAVALGTAVWYQKTPTAFLPEEDQGYIIIAIQLPDAASLDRTRELEQKLNRKPTPEELAVELEVDTETVLAITELGEPAASAHEPVSPGSDRLLLDSIADEYRQNPESRYSEGAAGRMLRHWLDQLTAQQREVVEHRYGLHGHGRRTLEEIGRLMGVTRERVRQIQMSALARLRDISSREGFAEIPYLE